MAKPTYMYERALGPSQPETWGDPCNLSTIELNEHPFSVTKNLAIALRHLRDECQVVVIWADAICINQQDLDEKATQVPRMTEIYNKSKKVIIWLGEEAEDSCYAMNFIHGIDRRLASRAPRLREDYLAMAQAFDDRALRAINRLLQRPWWSRAWIIQEATCDNETFVRCGRDVTDFTAFVATINCLVYYVVRLSLRGHALDQLREQRGQSKYRPCLLDMLDTFRTCEASDPRDKIFALSALVTGRGKEAATPDYSISVDQAYSKFAYLFILSERTLGILGHCQVAVRTIHSWSSFKLITPDLIPKSVLPSWVPDWTMMLETTPFENYQKPGVDQSERVYNATGSFPPSVHFTGGLGTLFVRGFTFDRILFISPEASSAQLTTIKSWYLWVETKFGSTYFTGESIREAFLRTIVADVSVSEGRCVRGGQAKWPVQDEAGSLEGSFDS
ncbi:heterokaryon incompatibility protein-domain-containing protein [Fusarium redolens]|uniref:Heterokaryon incompatibility protein-domain-containing protein n=1 Tax=Fusarium redolens TaxID=48865 RepID=A0A9P9KA98_FUSRE|nr:heterokaryon incompatibility protein-domain-containing protein [Fusarium redolens]KAH7255102.1 heterokaryon incompatibility protein-domain-containing protein [Fusarium redolens]